MQLQLTSMLRRRLNELLDLQQHTPNQPYSIVHRLKLAKTYRDLRYPDLAVSDAYKALLLIDEVVEQGEYHEEAVEAALKDIKAISKPQHNHCCCQGACEETQIKDEEKVFQWAKECWSRTA
jgi:hypothetical protein